MSEDGDKQMRSTKDIVISALLMALITISFMAFNGVKEDIDRLETGKADKAVIEEQLLSIKANVNEIKELIKNHSKNERR